MALTEKNDVVIRQKRGNPSTVYLLGTPSSPDQFTFARAMKPSRKPWPMQDGSICERGLPRATTTSCCSARSEKSS